MAAVLIAAVAVCTWAQDGPTVEDVSKKPVRDGHDRPTTYPKIRFGAKKTEAPAEDVDAAVDAVEKKLKTRVYLVDVSASMAKSLTIEGTRESTRLEQMVTQINNSLDALANRRDPNLRFNIVTFGSVQDFAGGGELQPVTKDSVKRAKEWLGKLEAKGDSDIYALLRECFEQAPDSATMLVGSLPTKPAGVDEAEYKKHKDAGEFLIARVKAWRDDDGKTTTLDITGVGLSDDEKAYYRRLAEAAGGTYLDA
ncbi:MAG: hypothetical protein K8I27_16665 [Planctomycetes bacterium]|nr:hypothetical protein [Planctomycetota bacterium]